MDAPLEPGSGLQAVQLHYRFRQQTWVSRAVWWNSWPCIQGSQRCCGSGESQLVCIPWALGKLEPAQLSFTSSVGLCRAGAKAGAPVSDLARLGTIAKRATLAPKELALFWMLYKSLLKITWRTASISSSPSPNSHMKLASFCWAFCLGDPALDMIFICLWTLHHPQTAGLVSKPQQRPVQWTFPGPRECHPLTLWQFSFTWKLWQA